MQGKLARTVPRGAVAQQCAAATRLWKFQKAQKQAPRCFIRLWLGFQITATKQEALMESITELYCLIDDFYKVFEDDWKHHVLTNGQRKRWRMTGISLPEMMTLVVLFHQLRHR